MYFYLFKSKANGQWYFNIRGGNHERIAQSEGYVSKQGAMNAINVIRSGAATGGVYDESEASWAA